MLKKVLIANRGEIALRVLRACRDLGIPAVVAYSEADRDSLPVRLADEAVCIGPPQSARSYNNIPAIISAARITGADAIHPGYGFLSENAYLADVCGHVGLTFVGPSSAAITKMGDKALARRLMGDAGLPLLPGSEEPLPNARAAQAVARRLGYPLILKAVAGGGGRGMRVVRSDRELAAALPTAQAEAEAAFGNGDIYVEKFLEQPRHIEVQVIADGRGHIVAVGERECSLQRRHQKVLEEAPAPNLSSGTRQNLYKAAIRGARAIGYSSVGTFEFLLARDGHFYFMEMNTRIQVEHPVTEVTTGIDLVRWQLRLAAGEPLTLGQKDIVARGHAIECRINAEDPERGFAPNAGLISEYVAPGGPGVRLDSHLFPGYVTPPYYDSLLAKLIVCGQDRQEAIARASRALEEFVISGIKTTIPFHQGILRDGLFRHADLSTDFIPQYLERTVRVGA
ncbi:MAG: acetyl-CoA carboxylase biotin carboxylase subunit [Chloroflexota bacterium]|nr:acetyl-CoA carboxylase biotin carboxylase subunit [Chloroflexota bacterium]